MGRNAVRRLVCLVFLAATLVARGALASEQVTILYTNDLHARLERLESLRGLVDAERKEGRPVLLLDAGDTWQDFRAPLPAVWGARETVVWMNQVGYSAMALGNHDLYFGAERLAALVGEAGFPVLSANLTALAGWKAPFLPYTFVTCGDLRVLVVGLTTGEFLPYADFPWLRYEDPAHALAEALEASRDQPRDLVVVLCHLPAPEACLLAEAAPEVDVFVTGHSHQETPQPIHAGNALIVQARPFGEALGRLRIEVDPGTPGARVLDNTLLETTATPVDVRPGLAQLLEAGLLLCVLVLLCFF